MRKGQYPCKTWFRSLARAARGLALAAALATLVTAAPRADTLANTCNSRSELAYPTAPNFSSVGDTVRIKMVLGAGGIDGGDQLTINTVRFELDCEAGNLGLNCGDEGAIVSYQGNLTTTCPTIISVSHIAGDAFPNQVVFTPATPIVIGENTSNFCAIEFDTKIEDFPGDATPDVIEQVSGFSANQNDGVCNTVPTLATGNTSSGSIQLCNCDDRNGCTDNECSSSTGCFYPPNTDPCDDNNVCTTVDTCAKGGCVGGGPPLDVDDGNVCTDDTCDPLTGPVHTPNSAPCDDANACTTTDTCVDGGCVSGPPRDPNDGNICTDDTCDPATGVVNTPNSAPCDDANACTTTDTCAAGSCVGGPPPVIDDGNVCTDDTCDPATGVVHTPNSAPCNDGNACTTSDTCAARACVGGPPPVIDDGNVCTDDRCDPATGPVHTPNSAPCDDANACTTSDTCAARVCVGGPPLFCGDGNICTDDSCNPATGCVSTPNTAPCADGNVCTTNDRCAGGGCQGGAPLVCDDSNICTDDSCDPATGCVNTPNSDPCDDGDECTTNDTCAGGVCQGSGECPCPDCDDGDPCTIDTCVVDDDHDDDHGDDHADDDHGDDDHADDDHADDDHADDDHADDDHADDDHADDDHVGEGHTGTDRGDGGLRFAESTSTGSNGASGDDHSADDHAGDDHTGDDHTGDDHTGDDHNGDDHEGDDHEGDDHEGDDHEGDDHDDDHDDDDTPRCVHTPDPTCGQVQGCRLTGGGQITLPGGTGTAKATFAGEVGSPFGFVGCHQDQEPVQGNWTYQRARSSGTFHVAGFNSLVCGCDGVFDGRICNPGDRDQGPTPPQASANQVCFSGTGAYTTGIGRGQRNTTVAFRVEAADRGEPGVGGGTGSPSDDLWVRVWIPTGSESAESLQAEVCCTVPSDQIGIRAADVNDGGGAIRNGNIQIHLQTGNSGESTGNSQSKKKSRQR